MGMNKKNIFVMNIGDVLEITEKFAKIEGTVPSGQVFVDGLGVGDVGNVVLRDRKLLSQDGLIIVTLTMEKYSSTVLAGPEIISRGFVYVKESEDLMEKARQLAAKTLEKCEDKDITDWSQIKSQVRDALKEFVWHNTKRRPMILTIIMEV